MTYKELYDYAYTVSGNFVIPEELIELGRDKFHIVLKNAIGWYQRYTPLLFTMNINTGSNINYTFTGFEYPKAGEWDTAIVPYKISDVFPAYSTFYNPFLYRQMTAGSSANTSSAITQLSSQAKMPFVWRYDPPVLHLDRGGEMEVKAMYYHPIIERHLEEESESAKAVKIEVDLPSISPYDIDFLDMMTGMFLMIVGRSRGMFNYSDTTVTFKADEMVSEGQNLVDKAQQAIIDNSDFYLAWS